MTSPGDSAAGAPGPAADSRLVSPPPAAYHANSHPTESVPLAALPPSSARPDHVAIPVLPPPFPGTDAGNRTDALPTYHEHAGDTPPTYRHKGAPTVYAPAVGIRAVFMRFGRGTSSGAENLARSRMPEGLRKNTRGCGTVGLVIVIIALGIALGLYFGLS